jgi:3-hydroxyacyl-CoA dehydrogenase
MRSSVKKVAVLGAGTMGSQIAALVANSGAKVILLDVVPKNGRDRTKLAKEAVENLKNSKSLSSKDKAYNIEPANMEDDLDKLKDADWIVECVPEDEGVKHETYQKIAPHLKEDVIVSSNTSAIPLRELKQGLDENLQSKLCLTHFFNPPDKMALLEVVADRHNDVQALRRIEDFADHALGKHIVKAEDTPGLIANRIGIYWIICGLQEAKTHGISIEMADKVMNGAFGFPKTGIFRLMDLIGLKLIPDIAESMIQYLDEDDDFKCMYDGVPVIQERIEQGYTGEKKGGFYREEGNRKQVFDLESGEYRDTEQPEIEIGEVWQAFLEKDVPESRFACAVLRRTLAYAAKVAPHIAADIRSIDSAMREGYNWEKGPFEMMDRLGAEWLIQQLNERGEDVPELLRRSKNKGFYREQEGHGKEYLTFAGDFQRIERQEGKWGLEFLVAGQKPVLQGDSAKLWDIGDGIGCFSLTKGKMRVLDEQALDLLDQSIDRVQKEFKGLVIGHDGKNFSAGFDLKIVLEGAEKNQWKRVDAILRQGQEVLLKLKRSPFPAVAAVSGYALGGGCEIAMQADAVQAHRGARIGLVETSIGVIPAWGGATESLRRAVRRAGGDLEKLKEEILSVFRLIAAGKKSDNAEHAFALGILEKPSRITMNRERLLPDAKALCLDLTEDYAVADYGAIRLPVESTREMLLEEVERMKEQEKITAHRARVLGRLADCLSGHAALENMHERGQQEPKADWDELDDKQILETTREAFIQLVRTEEAQRVIATKV